MWNWIRTKLELHLDRSQAHEEYSTLAYSLDLLHKRLDLIETTLGLMTGAMSADSSPVNTLHTGISGGRDPLDPAVQAESSTIAARAMRKIRTAYNID